jgi:Rad3-related DNA helicase
MKDNTERMNQLLDAQLLELEDRFNQFLKELEEDFNFVPSVIKHGKSDYQADDDYPEMDLRLTNIEKRYDNIDKKYTLVLTLTSAMALGALAYLWHVLSG